MSVVKPRSSDTADGARSPWLAIDSSAIDVRSTSLAILAGLGVLFFLHWASPVLIPIATAVVLSYTLTPVVTWLKRRLKIPNAVGAALTLGALMTAIGYGLVELRPQALEVLDIVPQATQKFTRALRTNPRDTTSAVDKVKAAATELERAANEASKPSVSPPAIGAATRSPAASFNFGEYLLMGTASVATGAGQFLVVICLVYFLLVTGDAFRRTLVRVSGDTLSKKKITVQILDEIDTQIQRYLLVQLATSALLGVVTWAVFAWMGLKDPVFWGSLGGLLHLIPYVGPTAFVAMTALVAFVQYDTYQPVVIIIGSVMFSIGVIGLILVPWLTQKVGKIKAVVVFLSLLIWGWLWGVWGLLLGVPIVMAINAVCERIEDLNPISEFLSAVPGGSVQSMEDGTH